MTTQGAFNPTPVLTQTIKFCDTCMIFRPPRTVHCNTCDCCIRNFDHHCLWLGTCIGARNYLSFLSYITLLNIALPIASYQAISAILELLAESEASSMAYSSVLGLYALATVFINVLVLVLFVYHSYLLCVNQTTYESVKKLMGRFPLVPNPNHQGNFFSNLKARARQQARTDSVIPLLVEVIGASK